MWPSARDRGASSFVACCLIALPLSLTAQEPAGPTGAEMPLTPEARSQALAALAPEYLEWLQSVRGLMSQPELDYFLRLEEDFRRDAFLRAFWEPRDPDPRTSRNELKERWEEYRDSPGGVPYGDPRFLLLLFNGPPGGWSLPDGRPVARCFSRARELEIWYYAGSERTDRRFPVILLRRGPEVPYEVYQPGQSLRAMQRSGGLPSTDIQRLCADELLRYTLAEISRIVDYDRLLRDVLAPPLPSPEWLANLAASATDLPRDAATFEVELELGFPARKQSRTALQVLLGVPREAAPGRVFDGEPFHDFQLTGEVIRDGKLFESFRYRFEGPTPAGSAPIPLGFTRFLRPGAVELRIVLEDVYGGRFARFVREIDVPAPEGLPALAETLEPRLPQGPSLELVAPAGSVHVGRQRFRARVTGEVEKVTFYVDDKPVLSKRSPPFSVELDLGTDPEPRRVRAVAFAGDGEVATDQLWLNQGPQRFRVYLVEPRQGGIYPGSLTARIQVDVPEGRPLERVELYLDDRLAATFRQPPFEHRLRLSDDRLAVVRAVAHLADGSSAEDAAVVNGSPYAETIEVRLVELEVLVEDAAGRPVAGLDRERFRVFEEGGRQEIERFEAAREAPISVAFLIDRSISMAPHLPRVAEAARTFAEAALRSPHDRVAVLSFADELTVDAGFTAGPGALERALAGLRAAGGTAFYDSLSQAFETFQGIRGPSALVLFTDGEDETSRLSFDQALAAARRARTSLYAIGPASAFPDPAARRVLERLAAETGGRAHFLGDVAELAGVYLEVLEELRARYLLAYRPPEDGPEGFRAVRVEVDVPGVRVRTRSGYHP